MAVRALAAKSHMTREDLERAGDLFDELGDLPQAEHGALLDRLCAGNAELRAEVERMLAGDRAADKAAFLQHHALHDAARLIESHEHKLPQPGSLIGNYLLGSQAGAGGMGVVYQAEDLRLHRRVAVKVLPLPFANTSDGGIKRFRREARAVSQLNHPNIVSIFEADFDQGCYYIATEFIEGETLRQMLARGPVDRKTLVEIAIQLCAALAAAHEAGIVHRDVKPDNIMIRPDGIVKVLDFGLSKIVREPAAASVSDVRTRPGSVVGTIQYLSPEQVLGKPASPLSDVFSAGVVIYELATGRRPFDGPTDGAIFSAIVKEEPKRPEVDGELAVLILRAMEKDPELRFQTAADMRAAFRLLSRQSSELPPANLEASPKRDSRLVRIAAGVSLLALGFGLGWWIGAPAKKTAAMPVKFERLTDGLDEKISPNLSPDGKQFFYASPAGGKWDIYLQRTGGQKSVNLTADSGADDTEPALSPGGGQIAFRSEGDGGGLFIMEATGENRRRVTRKGYLPAWSPDGKSIVYSEVNFTVPSSRLILTSKLHVVDLASGGDRKIETPDAVQPAWSPHGYRIAYWGLSRGIQRDIATVGLNGGVAPVTSDAALDWNPVWSPSGDYLYFLSDRGGTMNLWRVRIEERSGQTLAPPEPVTTPADSMAWFSLAADGKSYAYAQTHQRNNLFVVGYDPDRHRVIGEPALAGNASHNATVFSLSPDEKHIVYDTVGDSQEDLWIVNADGSGRRRLTNDAFKDRSPSWSPAGDRIVFMSDRSGVMEPWTIRADGSELRKLGNSRVPVQRPVWSSDGREVLVSHVPGSPEMLDLSSGRQTRALKAIPGLDATGAIFSPFPRGDGPLVAETLREKGWELLFYDLAKQAMSLPGILGRRPAWMPGEHELIFVRGSRCLLYDVVSKRETELFSVAPNTMYEVHATRDGKRIFFTQTIHDADLWLAHMKN